MEDCIFCKIAAKQIPSEIVYEDDEIIAFKDIEPQAPVHIIVIPKTHYENILNIVAGSDILNHVFMVINKLALKYGIASDGFRVVNNCGENGGQTVQHLHFHLLGGRKFGWPPG